MLFTWIITLLDAVQARAYETDWPWATSPRSNFPCYLNQPGKGVYIGTIELHSEGIAVHAASCKNILIYSYNIRITFQMICRNVFSKDRDEKISQIAKTLLQLFNTMLVKLYFTRKYSWERVSVTYLCYFGTYALCECIICYIKYIFQNMWSHLQKDIPGRPLNALYFHRRLCIKKKISYQIVSSQTKFHAPQNMVVFQNTGFTNP